MNIDYSPFLRPAEDGRIWWRLEDAIKLGAGYLPLRDDDCNLVPVLRAPNNRVRADERTLMGDFGDDRLVVARPRLLERDGVRFVRACEFLTWLSLYVAQTETTIAFPNDLAREVKDADGLKSLTAVLEDWFDKPLAELPDALRQRVEEDLFPMPWDGSSPEQRRSLAQQWDYQNDPATQGERTFWWDFFVRKGKIEKEVVTWEAVASPTAGELALKEAKLKELRQELARMEQQRRQARGDYRQETLTSPCEPVSASQIRDHFPVIRDRDANERWWKQKMRDAKRYGLVDCRVGEGKKGRGEGSLWRPDLIATWLVERHEKGRQGLSAKAARSALAKFPGCEAFAEEQFADRE